ncbi:MAG: hypothetical protein HYZ37_03395 [Candidatus Solibacter usitatus]|nr:hypothetical protein [Candidatus Solibacter usitatus]
MIAPSEFKITTLVLLALISWVLFTRFRKVPGHDWPLVGYAAAYFYLRNFPDVLEENYIIAGGAVAILNRFEFLGEKVQKFMALVDIGFLFYILARCLSVFFGR